MPIQPVEKKTVVDSIVEQIRKLIIDGELKAGDKLDSERMLAEKFHVGRPSIRESLKVLTSLGIVEKQNDGNYISTNVLESLHDPLLFHFLLNKENFKDLFEARKILELEIVKLAINNINSEQLVQMKKNLIRTKKNISKPRTFTECDVEFHILIAEAADNYVLLTFLDTIRNLLKQSTIKLLSNDKMTRIALEYHQKIYNAITEKDKEAATKYMYEHLEFARIEMIKLNDQTIK